MFDVLTFNQYPVTVGLKVNLQTTVNYKTMNKHQTQEENLITCTKLETLIVGLIEHILKL